MNPRYASTRAQRLEWLRARPELWQEIVGPGPELRALGRLMREAGLYSAKTRPRDLPLWNQVLQVSLEGSVSEHVEDAVPYAMGPRDFGAELAAARARFPWPPGLPRFSSMGAP
jgi:hypothetical protein